MYSKLLSQLAAILWAAFVAAALLAPGDVSAPDLEWALWLAEHGGDKLIHMMLFLGQAFWLSSALAGREGRATPLWRAAALSALYGLALETAQLAVPGRGFEVADLVANTAGALLWPPCAWLSERIRGRLRGRR